MKTLEQIRAEKRLKLMNRDNRIEKLEDKSVVSTNHYPCEVSPEDKKNSGNANDSLIHFVYIKMIST